MYIYIKVSDDTAVVKQTFQSLSRWGSGCRTRGRGRHDYIALNALTRAILMILLPLRC